MMNEEYAEEFLRKVEAGLLESQQLMLKEKALHDQDVIVTDGEGRIVRIPAKEVLRTHPELRCK